MEIDLHEAVGKGIVGSVGLIIFVALVLLAWALQRADVEKERATTVGARLALVIYWTCAGVALIALGLGLTPAFVSKVPLNEFQRFFMVACSVGALLVFLFGRAILFVCERPENSPARPTAPHVPAVARASVLPEPNPENSPTRPTAPHVPAVARASVHPEPNPGPKQPLLEERISSLEGRLESIERTLALRTVDAPVFKKAGREQSFASVTPYTIEEAYEVADAIARGDREKH